METSDRADYLIELARDIVKNEMALGVEMEYHELLVVVTMLEENHLLDSFLQQFNGVIQNCPCNGSHCPGKLVVDDQNNLLAIATIVENAKVRQQTPIEYLNTLILQNQTDLQTALDIAEASLKGNKEDVMKIAKTATKSALGIAERLAHFLAGIDRLEFFSGSNFDGPIQ